MKRRPILAILFLLMGMANLLRATLVPEVQTVLDPEMLSLSLSFLGWLYGLFGVGFTVLAILAWRGRAMQLIFPFAVVYQALLWTIRFIGYLSPYAQVLWARDLVLTVLFLLIVLVLARPGREQTERDR